ncbi:hypothetical protein MUK42_08880 [Musa troglodytarum]|uniref:Uncharacterized protein n=1 Tax=Musa troglodytarum TaxID=320322 RepID=A0A9E7JC10_9LILI|nr:hypothetical protein MUK42_08880 [Musa troglodytarum]
MADEVPRRATWDGLRSQLSADDYLGLGAPVCKSWQSAVPLWPDHLPTQLPFFLFHLRTKNPIRLSPHRRLRRKYSPATKRIQYVLHRLLLRLAYPLRGLRSDQALQPPCRRVYSAPPPLGFPVSYSDAGGR